MNETTYFLAIGIDAYKDGKHLLKLNFAEKGCRDLQSILCDPEIGTVLGKHAHFLSGKEATTKSLQETFHDLKTLADENIHNLIVYFSGHAFALKNSDHIYLASHDVDLSYLQKNPQCRNIFSILKRKCFFR